MAWIESHQAIENHPKLCSLIALTNVSKNECIGIIHRLWWWSLSYAEDGNLNKYNPAIITASLSVDVKFYDHLMKSGWIDDDNYIHDWWDYAGRFLQVRYKHKPEKWQQIKTLYEDKKNRSKNTPKNRHTGSSKNPKPNLTNQTKPNLTNLPDWMPVNEFNAFIEMRTKAKKKPTEKAIELLIKELEKLKEQGNDPKAVIEKAIMNGWQGFYPLKGDSYDKNRGTKQTSDGKTGKDETGTSKYDGLGTVIDIGGEA